MNRLGHTDFDLLIIGGGAAGLTAAAGGAALGARVALVEKHRLGGDCLWTGCVPSKALLAAAKHARSQRTAARFGLPAHDLPIALAPVMDYVNSVIETIAPHDSPERFRGLGVDVIFGAGRFIDPRTFEVNGRRLTAKNFVIATGSRPAPPPLPGLEHVPFLTNETVFDLRENAPHLIVLGGGPIGVELAQAFRRLGSAVTLVQRGPQLLPAEDADIADIVTQRLRAEGVTLEPGATTLRVEGTAGDIRLHLRSIHSSPTPPLPQAGEGARVPSGPGEGQSREILVRGSHLLVATGRHANVENLGLDAAGITLANGRIATDARLRTTAKNIYACGDVTGPHLFTHMAEHHAGVVLRNALFHLPAKVESRVIPWCTYCDPEVARVGLSENEARGRAIPHRVYTFPFGDLDRARAEDETSGLAKLITDPKGRILGAAIAGPHAGELIHEYALALAKNMKAKDLSNLIHVYPTFAQINRRAADQRLKSGLTPGAKKWIKRLFRLRGA